MNKMARHRVSIVIFIFIVSTIFLLQTKEVVAQSSEELNQSAKAQVGFRGGEIIYPEQPKESEEIPQNNIALDLILNQSEEVQIGNQDQYIDPKILEEFNKSSNVRIIVEVRDTTNISIGQKDTINQQVVKDLRKKEFLENKTNAILSKLSASEFKLKKKLQSGKAFSGNITLAGFNRLLNDTNVEMIWLNKPAYITLDKSGPLINADDVKSAGYTGLHQTVCVLDTGIDYDHADLGGCFGATCKVRGGYDYYTPDSDPDDDNGHGTNIAGIIASTDSTYEGIAPDARLVAIKVCSSLGSCDPDDIKDGLFYCYQNRNIYNISVVSISIGDNGEYPPDCPPTVNTEVSDLYNVGIPVVVSSGNNGHTNGISWPACTPNAISVGAVYDDNMGREPDSPNAYCLNPPSCTQTCFDSTTAADQITCFTNMRVGVLDLLAPGCRINSTEPGGGFEYMCGTSQAAPHVSGIAALLFDLDDTLTSEQILTTLQDTGETVGSYDRVDALAALNSIRDKDNDDYYDEAYGGNDCDDNDAGVNPGATEVCDDIDNDCDDVIDEGCTEECSEPGYEQCAESSYGDCDVSIAVNYYTNVNNIQWGAVNDANDPYVIDEYRIGWKDVDAEEMYYDVEDPNNDCEYGGCDGTSISGTGTRVTTTAPGTASTENVLGYDDTASYWCTVWFNGFNPNYGGSNPIYVLNCFDDDDCSASQYCDKSGSWNSWDCVNKKSDGQSCTEDFECSSNYCDNDDVGLSDDDHCFTPYNTYFDGQETSYCEYSTDNGIADCDERTVGTDLNKCIGTSYYEEECSSSCQYTDITSVFECTETGCSCTTSECDGIAPQGTISYCDKGGQTYFQDDCGTTATAEDTDSICRSSAFAASCTADSQCNGITAGTTTQTGSCSATCTYDAFPNVTLVNPQNNNISTTGNIIFNCSATDDNDLDNITLYHNISGTWQANETKSLSGTSDSETFTINNIPDNTNFIWNCLAFDNNSQSGWSNTNYTTSVNIPQSNITITSFTELYSNNNIVTFQLIIENNGDTSLTNVNWTIDFGDNNTAESYYPFNLTSGEDILVFIEHEYTDNESHTVIANANAGNLSTSESITVGETPLEITSFTELYSMGRLKTWQFIIENQGEDNLTDIYWNITGSAVPIASIYPITLTPNESILVYVEGNLTGYDEYTITAKAFNGDASDSSSITSKGKEIEVSDIDVMYTNGTIKTFEFFITNTYNSLITSVNWSFYTGEETINSNIPFNLTASEDIQVILQAEYSGSGNYTVNVSTKSAEYSDWEEKTIIV